MTQEVFERVSLQWPDRGSTESIVKFMNKAARLLHKVCRVGNHEAGTPWSGGQNPSHAYNVQCILRVLAGILEDFDFDTVASMNFGDWLKYLPDQNHHCKELAKQTYGSITAQFAPLTPTEVCAWAGLLYSKDAKHQKWLKAIADVDPNTVWKKFLGIAALGPANCEDSFAPCPSEFFGFVDSESKSDLPSAPVDPGRYRACPVDPTCQ